MVFIVWFKRKANEKPYIFTSAIPMATKVGRVVTCDGLLITWSRDKFKRLISALP